MKKFNLFAIGVVAMLMAAVNVNAATYTDEAITTAGKLKTCLEQADAATCTVTESIPDFTGAAVTGKVTLTLNKGVVVTTTGAINLNNEKASLTVDGGTITRSDATGGAATVVVRPGATLDVKGTTLKTDLTKFTAAGHHGNKSVITIYGSSTKDGYTANVTLEAGSKLEGYTGLTVLPSAPGSDTAKGAVYNVNVNLNGDIKAEEYAVHVNGTVEPSENVNVKVTGGTYTSTRGIALYAAGVSNWTITGGTITGLEGLVVRAGTVSVDGGKISAVKYAASVGTRLDTRVSGGAQGAAIVVEEVSGYNTQSTDKTVVFDITKGTVVAEDGNALYVNGTDVAPTVKGGTFETQKLNTAAVAVTTTKTGSDKFISGGSFILNEDTTGIDAIPRANLAEDFALGSKADGSAVVGKEITIKVEDITGITSIDFSHITSIKAVEGSTVDLLKELKMVDATGAAKNEPALRANRYAVKYVLSNGTTGLDEFTMVSNKAVTIKLEIVEVPEDTEASEDIPATPTPGTDTEDQGGNQGSENQGSEGETTKPGANNPDTLDNVTSVAAMGGISLAIAAAGIATLKKREN